MRVHVYSTFTGGQRTYVYPTFWCYAHMIIANYYSSVFKSLVPNDLSCCTISSAELELPFESSLPDHSSVMQVYLCHVRFCHELLEWPLSPTASSAVLVE